MTFMPFLSSAILKALPAPLSPTMATISPSYTFKSTPSTAFTPPKYLHNFLTSKTTFFTLVSSKKVKSPNIYAPSSPSNAPVIKDTISLGVVFSFNLSATFLPCRNTIIRSTSSKT